MLSLFKKQKITHVLSLVGSEITAPIKQGQSILEAATSAKIKFPNMCNVGECGTCKCQVLEGDIKLKRDITKVIPIEEINKGYILACQSIPQSNVTVQLPETSNEPQTNNIIPGIIENIRNLTHDIQAIDIKLEREINFIAGQYAQLTVPSVVSLADSPRNYSFAHCQSENNSKITFYIRHVPGGLFTDWLFDKNRVGQAVNVQGPYGDFHYRKSKRPLIFIAGGSGFAPIKAILEQMQKSGAFRPVTLLFGAREKQDLYCLDEIKELASSWKEAFSFHPILSELKPKSNSSELRGFITDHIDDLVKNLTESDTYLCGPPAMIDSVMSHLEPRIPTSRIYFDKFLDQSSTLN